MYKNIFLTLIYGFLSLITVFPALYEGLNSKHDLFVYGSLTLFVCWIMLTVFLFNKFIKKGE